MEINNQHTDFENFRNYYTGKMSTEEKVAFEKKLEEDPFAKEAYEGFLFLENDYARISAIENTNMVLKDKFKISTKSNTFPIKYLMTIAASLVLFLGSYFVIQSNLFDKNESLADNHIQEEEISEIIEQEEINTNATDTVQNDFHIDTFSTLETVIENEELLKNKETSISEIEKPVVKKQVQQSPEPVQNQESKQINEAEFDDYKKLKESNEDEKEESSSISIQASASEKDKATQYTNTIYTDDSEALVEEPLNTISEYKKGIAAYNQSNYNKAIKHFNNSINGRKSLAGSNYYIAMSYFNQNKSLKAIKYFDKTINIGSSYKDNALWYKSLTLLNRGEKIEAKMLLTEISNSNSNYKNAAIKKLASLD